MRKDKPKFLKFQGNSTETIVSEIENSGTEINISEDVLTVPENSFTGEKPKSAIEQLNELLSAPVQSEKPQIEISTDTEIKTENFDSILDNEKPIIENEKNIPQSTAELIPEDLKENVERIFFENFGVEPEEISLGLWRIINYLRELFLPKLIDKLADFSETERKLMLECAIKRDNLINEGKTDNEIILLISERERKFLKWYDELRLYKIQLPYSEAQLKKIADLFAKEVVSKWHVPQFLEGSAWVVQLGLVELEKQSTITGFIMERKMSV